MQQTAGISSQMLNFTVRHHWDGFGSGVCVSVCVVHVIKAGMCVFSPGLLISESNCLLVVCVCDSMDYLFVFLSLQTLQL